MASFWRDKKVALARVKVSYWTKRLKEGRDDPVALEKYARYVSELEELKAQRSKVVLSTSHHQEDVSGAVIQEYVPKFEVTFD